MRIHKIWGNFLKKKIDILSKTASLKTKPENYLLHMLLKIIVSIFCRANFVST